MKHIALHLSFVLLLTANVIHKGLKKNPAKFLKLSNVKVSQSWSCYTLFKVVLYVISCLCLHVIYCFVYCLVSVLLTSYLLPLPSVRLPPTPD